jgi:hypothetical protein
MIELNPMLSFALASYAIAEFTGISRIATEATATAPDDTSMKKPSSCTFELARNNSESLLCSEKISNPENFFSGYGDLNR